MNNNYSLTQRNELVEKHLWCIDTVIRKNRPLMRAAQLEYDDVYQQLAIRLIKAVACRLCGLTGAPKEYRKRDMVSLDALSESDPLYERAMAA